MLPEDESEFFITEGSNYNGLVETTFTSINPGQELSSYEFDRDQTDTSFPEGYDIFQHFPTGTEGGPIEDDNAEVRNPLNVCRDILGTCEP